MKKLLVVLSVLFLLSSCGNKPSDDNNLQQNTGSVIETNTGAVDNENSNQPENNNENSEETLGIEYDNANIKEYFLEGNDKTINDTMNFVYNNISQFSDLIQTNSKMPDYEDTQSDIEEIKQKITEQTEGEIMQEVYSNILFVKGYINNDASYCDSISYEDGDENLKSYCLGDYYVFQVLKTKDRTICDNFSNSNFNNVDLMGAKPSFDVQSCNRLYELATSQSHTKSSIDKALEEMLKSQPVSNDLKNIFYSYLLGEDNCDNILSLGTKVKCMGTYYKESFFEEFSTKVYPKLTESKLLYAQ